MTEWDTRVGCYGVIVRDGALLLTHWSEHGNDLWLLPGGGMEAGEQPEQTLVREIREESGYDAVAGPLLTVQAGYLDPAVRATPTDRGLRVVRVVYGAEITGGEMAVEIGGSSDDVRWFPLDALPDNRHELVDQVLAMRSGMDHHSSSE